MKNAFKNIIVLTSFLLTFSSLSFAGNSEIMQAMSDELNRSAAKLKISNLQKPYFISYTVSDSSYSAVSASFGAVNSMVDKLKTRRIKAEVRIGNNKFDSSLFVSDPFGTYLPSSAIVSAEGGYDALRFNLWQLTDVAYKNALDAYAKKQAFVQSRNISETFDDLTQAEKLNYTDTEVNPDFDTIAWQEHIRRLSAIFKKYPKIRSSAVTIYNRVGKNYFLNSEGSKYKKNICYGSLDFSAISYSEDGYANAAADSIAFCNADRDLPPYEDIASRVNALAQRLSKQSKASLINAYIGPILLEGNAAGKFFETLLVNNISNPREVWKAENQWAPGYIYSRSGDLNERLGMRVLPPFLSVYDDPSIHFFNGRYLAGSYKIDDEGVPVKKIELVRRGNLIDYYRFRAATRDFNFSNGHGRASVRENITGAPGNIFINPDENSSHALPYSSLKQKLIEICKEQELPYGLIVKDLLSTTAMFSAVKVFSDGHEEPVHGLVFTGLTLRSLRDIVFASYEQNVYSLNWNPAASLVHPSIIIQEMEIKKTLQKPQKKPYLAHPYFDSISKKAGHIKHK